MGSWIVKYAVLCLLLCLMVPAAAQDAAATQELTGPRQCVRGIQSYVTYYGEDRIDDLAAYDLAILEPDGHTAEEIAALHEKGTLAVAYLSVGQVEPYRAWYGDGRVDHTWLLNEDKNWDSYFVDANQQGWRDLTVELAGDYLAQGYDGLFLDVVDAAEVYPETAPGMVALIQGLREAYPEAIIVQNRGFAVIDETAPLVDALMFEGLSTSYDFDKKDYLRLEDTDYVPEVEEEIAQLLTIRETQPDLVVLSLDYAAEGNTETAQDAVRIALSYGFIPSVSTLALDDIPDFGLRPTHRKTRC